MAPLDAVFLSAETPAMPMHMVAVVVMEPGSACLTVAEVRQMVLDRLDAMPELRRRAVPTPFGVDHAVWVDDPSLDLEHHVRAAALPRPGGRAELAVFLADLAERPLDLDRPLWGLTVLEGLESGHVALVAKVHHALVDGVAGLASLAGFFDLAPLESDSQLSDHVPLESDPQLSDHVPLESDPQLSDHVPLESDPQLSDHVPLESDSPDPELSDLSSPDPSFSSPHAPGIEMIGGAALGSSLPGVVDLLAMSARRWLGRPLAVADAVAGTYLAVRTLIHEQQEARPSGASDRCGEGRVGARRAGDEPGIYEPEPGEPEPGEPEARNREGPMSADDRQVGAEDPWHRPRSRFGAHVPFEASRAPWNGAIGAGRSMAMVDLPLADLRMVARTAGATVNDVLLTGVGGALRRCLERVGSEPSSEARPLLAMVPVSVRLGTQGRYHEATGTVDAAGETASTASGTAAGNDLSAMVVTLATDIVDPLARLRAVAEATAAAKARLAVIPGGLVTAWAELAVPALTTRLARLATNLRLFDRLPPLANVVVSDMVGPEIPLWCAGRRVVAIYPFGPVADGIGLNITAVSYGSSLGVGLSSCRRLLPDVADLAYDLRECLGDLTKQVAGLRRSGA